MASTREQAEAYTYANRRMSTSILRGTDEARLDPRRRLNRALGSGVAVGVLAVAGFGIAGVLGAGSGPELPDRGVVVVGSGGDPYVVRDGVVHPALNLASALLVGGGEVTEIRQETLDEAPRGLPVGIPAAPDALPGAGDLVDDDWTLCATPSETGGAPTQTALYVSVPDAAAERGASGATVLVEADGALWLLAEGRRYALEPAIRDMLNLPVEPVPLPREVVATVPEGPEITIPGTGPGTGKRPEAALPFPARVGDLAHVETGGSGRQHFAVRPDGLVPLTALVYTLLAGDSRQDHGISVSDAAGAPRSAERPPGNGAWPRTVPKAAEPERDQPVCVSTPPGGAPGDTPWQATVHLPPALPEPAEVRPVTSSDGAPLGLLDRIYVPPGAGAVVRSTASGGSGGTYNLITDGGTAYRFVSPEAVTRLGYEARGTPSVPRAYVDLLPTGPVLDPRTAAREQRGEDT
ncbi:type VII secretion protein EccB [Streptomyces sp. MAR4 CNX-425]|uniref:type VII secretion protein EccB n=1 Tax=Streptomyces sp. MAR4 CNX-425 TaxID=3406343 RepID=UPI003B5093F1